MRPRCRPRWPRSWPPYLDAVRAENGGEALRVYPGSPLIARRLMRAQDTLVVNELHPEERAHLQAAVGRDRRVKVMALDGWTALKSLLPPKERRGIVLIDPPFEEERELERLAHGLAQGLRRFETGVYLAWYPIKDPRPDRLAASRAGGHRQGQRCLASSSCCAARSPLNVSMVAGSLLQTRRTPCGEELAVLLPEIARRLGEGGAGHYRIDANWRLKAGLSRSAASGSAGLIVPSSPRRFCLAQCTAIIDTPAQFGAAYRTRSRLAEIDLR